MYGIIKLHLSVPIKRDIIGYALLSGFHSRISTESEWSSRDANSLRFTFASSAPMRYATALVLFN